jgi:hypothetical protein
VRSVADQNRIARMDAVIHNAGVYTERSRGATREGHSGVVPVKTLAPYILTALMERPARLVYLSSGPAPMRRGMLDDSTVTDVLGIRRDPTPKASCTSSRSLRWRDVGEGR